MAITTYMPFIDYTPALAEAARRRPLASAVEDISCSMGTPTCLPGDAHFHRRAFIYARERDGRIIYAEESILRRLQPAHA